MRNPGSPPPDFAALNPGDNGPGLYETALLPRQRLRRLLLSRQLLLLCRRARVHEGNRSTPRRSRRHRSHGGRRRLRCGWWRGVTLALLKRSQAGYIALVLFERLREGVAAGAVSHEIEFLGARRIGNRFERRSPRIGNRPWRQAVDDIGVVGGCLFDLAAQNGPAECALTTY